MATRQSCNASPAKYKQLRDGLLQLLEEGVIQSFDTPGEAQSATLLELLGERYQAFYS